MKYLISILLCLLLPSLANAAPRTALVIGNSEYRTMPLANPVNDATDMAAKLESLGFQVIFETNQSKTEVKRLIREFGQKLRHNGGVGFFFYAGHGLQIEGTNYIVPVDFSAQAAYEVADESVNIGMVTGAMEEAGNPLNIIVLDACRDNPFPRKNRSSSRGLARISSASGTLIAYSTGPGDVAVDGDGRNSPYTEYLLKYMGVPGLTIEQVFKKVRVSVEDQTRGKQLPWETSSLRGEFYFLPGKPPSSLAAPVTYQAPRRQQATLRPPMPSAPPIPVVSNTKKLSIFTNPEDSTVTLLNSSIAYSRGVKLEPGDYRIEVRKSGYITKKKWINIDSDDLSIQITLTPDY